jgi:uncharacterized protein (UPF0264 family)
MKRSEDEQGGPFDFAFRIVYNRDMTFGVKVPRSMALLVSVADADEAIAALDGGADVIDAKAPARGALGAVDLDTLGEIHAAVGGRAMVTAALGAARDVHRIERLAADYSGRGASLVKIGFAGVCDARRVDALIAAAGRGCATGCGVVAVAYADAAHVSSIDAWTLVDVAARSGARGVLVDTVDKSGPGLTAMWTPAQIASWVSAARGWGLIAAIAGRLNDTDLAMLSDVGADVVGVRGAACLGERTDRISADRVRSLRAQLHDVVSRSADLASSVVHG